MEATSDIAKNS